MRQWLTTTGGAVVLDGDRLRDRIIAEIAADIGSDSGLSEIGLAIVLAGSDPSSREYVESKREWARIAGISTRIIELRGPTHDEILSAVEETSSDGSVRGLVVQLPLPVTVRSSEILDAIPLEKDVDGLSSQSLWSVVSGTPIHVPCTPLAIIRFIDHYRIAIADRRAVVVSETFGEAVIPMALLAARHCQVAFAPAESTNLAEACRSADLLVSAANRPGLITGDHVKPGAAVFDLGIDGTAAGLPGDVRYDEARDHAGWITPVPGGMGAMTIACLLENTLAAARRQRA